MMGPASRRRGSQLALVGLIVGLAWPVAAQSEQPVDPYAQPTPTPTPTPADPDAAAEAADLDEKVAAALHDRGVHLFGADQLAGAKEMFIESLERSPSGATAIEALRMLRQTNQRLGVANLDDGRPAGAAPAAA